MQKQEFLELLEKKRYAKTFMNIKFKITNLGKGSKRYFLNLKRLDLATLILTRFCYLMNRIKTRHNLSSTYSNF